MTIDQDTIDELAVAPERTTTDEGTVQERPIKDIIEADKYSKATNIGDSPLHGLRISRCKPAGP